MGFLAGSLSFKTSLFEDRWMGKNILKTKKNEEETNYMNRNHTYNFENN